MKPSSLYCLNFIIFHRSDRHQPTLHNLSPFPSPITPSNLFLFTPFPNQSTLTPLTKHSTSLHHQRISSSTVPLQTKPYLHFASPHHHRASHHGAIQFNAAPMHAPTLTKQPRFHPQNSHQTATFSPQKQLPNSHVFTSKTATKQPRFHPQNSHHAATKSLPKQPPNSHIFTLKTVTKQPRFHLKTATIATIQTS